MNDDRDQTSKIPLPTIQVAATATVEAVPDEAQLHFNLNAEGRSSSGALDAVRKRLGEFDGICDRLEIAADDRSSTVTVSEHGERDGGRWLSKGYKATARVRVMVRNVEVVGQLVNDAVSTAGPAVRGPYWQVSPDHPARLEACGKAAKQARQKAETYAEALGVGLGDIVTVAEPGVSVEPMMRSMPQPAAMARSAAPEGASEPTIDLHPGTQDIRAEIEVVFQLDQG